MESGRHFHFNFGGEGHLLETIQAPADKFFTNGGDSSHTRHILYLTLCSASHVSLILTEKTQQGVHMENTHCSKCPKPQ